MPTRLGNENIRPHVRQEADARERAAELRRSRSHYMIAGTRQREARAIGIALF
jgi:hypothetical protein